MAVTKVGWQGHLSRSGSNSDGTRFAEEYFVVVTDQPYSTVQIEGASDGTLTAPVFGSQHPSGETLYCTQTEYTPIEQDTRHQFQCRAQYTFQIEQNPLSLPAEVEWDFSEDGDKPYFLDCTTPDAQPVVNSANELFADFLTRSEGSITATYTKNFAPSAASAMAQTLITYTHPVPAINDGGFSFDGLSIGDGQGRIKGGSISGISTLNGVQYRSIKFSLAFKESWDDVEDDRGFNESYEDADGKLKLREIAKGQPPIKPDKPWPLDGDGNALPNISDAPETITFKPYPKMSFGVFSFS